MEKLLEGTKLELEIAIGRERNNRLNLVSQFEWREDEDVICIAAPIHKGMYYPIYPGTVIGVYFLQNNEMYKFDAKVIDRFTKENNIKFMRLMILSDFFRIQRREFYRFGCLLPILFRKIASLNNEINEDVPFSETITKDISGGGLCIKTKEEIMLNDLVECKLDIEDYGCIMFFARAVRIDRIKNNSEYKYESGLEYINIENRDKEAIIAYIFKKQRMLRGKGLL